MLVIPDVEALRPAVVRAIREITGCPDVVGEHGDCLSEAILDAVREGFSEAPKPCPFCGGTASVIWRRDGSHVECDDCGASGPTVMVRGDDPDRQDKAAIQSWNNRQGD